MAWHSSDPWTGIESADDQRPGDGPRPTQRSRAWPVWALTALAFVSGALISAAVFTIGWRHQTQQTASAESALVAETARNHQLTDALATAREAAAQDHRAATNALAALRTARALGVAIGKKAGGTQDAAATVTSNAITMASATERIGTELKTLTTYLTTTPTDQLDSGYIRSQAAYLTRQVDTLQSDSATTTTASATFSAAITKLRHLAAALAAQKHA